MYNIHGDYLMTYDPNYKEEHTDSSDFDETCIPIVTKKRGNHKLLSHERYPKPLINNPSYIIRDRYEEYDQYPTKLSKKSSNEIWETKATHFVNTGTNVKRIKKNIKAKSLNRGDQPQAVPSKISIIRHKIIPCLSSMFRRPHTKIDSRSVIKENQVGNTVTDNVCQHCSSCERRRMRKLYKRQQNYAVQPVYAIEGDIHKPFGRTKTKEPLKHHASKKTNRCSSCSTSSSSESETRIADRKQKTMKLRKRFKTEVMKEHWKYQQNQRFKNQQHQYPSKDHKTPYQVFSSPYQQSRTNVSASESQYAEMPATSSGFWDYLFDKINRKYQTQRLEMPKPCQCSSGEQQSCSPMNCENLDVKVEPSCCKGRQQSPPGAGCSCKANAVTHTPQKEIANGCCQGSSNKLEPNGSKLLSQPSSLTMKPKQEKKTDVVCKCHDKSAKQSKDVPKNVKIPSLGSQGPGPKPCQEGHDEIGASLAEKYNGEILCIHNPPCILINGCLNLPPPKETNQMNFWPVTDSKRTAFTKKKVQKYEQACQYHVPYVEIRQCQIPEFKIEKKIQSICNHDPPCEVVRGCHKARYDPTLRNSCVHVPMCKKIPECIVGRAELKNSCEHKPKCPHIPLCSRNLTDMSGRENFGAQVKPKMMYVCRHSPPCIMIPKCLGRAMCQNYVPSEAIPDCVHQPSCDMIPACCRKSIKEMVSVSSQYPNSCRIV